MDVLARAEELPFANAGLRPAMSAQRFVTQSFRQHAYVIGKMQAGTARAQRPGHRNHVAASRAAAPFRVRSPHLADSGDRDHPTGGARNIAARNRAAMSGG